MKQLLFILALVFGVSLANAQSVTFAGQGTVQSATNIWFLVPPGDGSPRVEFINAASDKAASFIAFYNPSGNQIVLTNTPTAGTTNITFTSNSTLTNGDFVVIRHSATGNTWKYQVGAATATNVFLSMPLSNAVVAGDVLQEYQRAGRVAWGAATNSLNANGGGIFNGLRAQPVLVELDSTSAGNLNVVSGIYAR